MENFFHFFKLAFVIGQIILNAIFQSFIHNGTSGRRRHVERNQVVAFYFKVGKSWGGLELGGLFITDSTPSLHTLCHEHGHGFQNCLWGILYPFVIGIPSAIRYWYREYLVRCRNKKYSDLPPYDSIWFEGQASRWGTKFFG